MSDQAWYQIQVDVASLAPAGRLREAIGMETLGGTFTPLIRKGSGVPASWSQAFSTSEDNQSIITLRLFRGNNTKRTKAAVAIGEFTVSGIAPASRGTPGILVEFKIDARGMWLRAQDKIGDSNLIVARVAS